ncbi:MAG: hypothetical protein CVU39_26525 [Chloroflexi bacterium HGW-Chloroflexi-10]|nr:MAG: hypothetical protein CVU39_26525 [Chloroflexi bacterium HGW-Chloroflexi-10]
MRIQVKDMAGNLSACTKVFIYCYYATHVTMYYGLSSVTTMSQDGEYFTSSNRGLKVHSGAIRVISEQVSLTVLVVGCDR